MEEPNTPKVSTNAAPELPRPTVETDATIHYKELTSFFKSLVRYTVGFLVFLLTATGFFFYSSVNDVRKAVDEMRTRVQSDIFDLKRDAFASLQSTRDNAKEEIQSVRREAAKEAISEAQRRVDEAFKSANIGSLIESAAKRHVEDKVATQVRQEVEQAFQSLQGDLATLGLIADSGVKLRLGWRPGYEELDSLRVHLPNMRDRDRAAALLTKITQDYERSAMKMVKEPGYKSPLQAGIQIFGLTADSTLNAKLVQEILKGEEMNFIALAFLCLRESSRKHFRMFDFQEVERWAKDQRF